MPDPKNKRPGVPADRPSRPAAPRSSRPAVPRPGRSSPAVAKDVHGETTTRTVLSPELLSSLRDESEKVTVRRRIVIGPDGVPRVLDDGEEDETTRRITIKPRDDE